MSTSLPPMNVAVIGCGNFVTGTHLPNLARLSEYRVYAAADTDSARAEKVAAQYGAEYATADYRAVLADPRVDLVITTTPHNLHAQLSIEAAKTGKHVLVEKPMALNRREMRAVAAAVRAAGVTYTVGLNRRYAPLAEQAKALIAGRPKPWMVTYRMVDAVWTHWAIDPVVGGGRIISETCHIFDFLCWLLDADPVRVYAEGGALTHPQFPTTQDNAVMVVRFADGSLATITHGDLGTSAYPKERIEVFPRDGAVVIEDFRSLRSYGFPEDVAVESPVQDKGHYRELVELAAAIREHRQPLVDLSAAVRAHACCFAAIEALTSLRVQTLAPEDWTWA